MPSHNIDKDTARLDRERGKMNVKMAEIIGEQEALITASDKAIKKINSDLKAWKVRLTPYVEGKKEPDEMFEEMKDQYEQGLQSRAALQRAIQMAEESITAAKLHAIPGEDHE